jgi:CHASE3 domain
LDVLGPQVNARIAASAELVAARQQTGPLPTLAQLEHGKQLMDAARATILEVEAEENRLLDERAQKTRTARRLTMSVIILGSLMGTGFLVIAGFAISQQIGANARARAQVNALNAELEQRVEQRTAALGGSEGRLAGIIRYRALSRQNEWQKPRGVRP